MHILSTVMLTLVLWALLYKKFSVEINLTLSQQGCFSNMNHKKLKTHHD